MEVLLANRDGTTSRQIVDPRKRRWAERIARRGPVGIRLYVDEWMARRQCWKKLTKINQAF
jgi:hypothetical protein